MKGLHLAHAADPLLATTSAAPVITPVQRTSSATRCDRMGVCLSLMPPCAACDLVRGLSAAERPYTTRQHTLCAND